MRNFDKTTRRGAALIIAIAIMTVLLAIGLTFFTVARVESTTAKNVVNTVRAEHLVDAGFAIAEYQLNRDLQDHPQATSLDHSWRTLFNGAAFQGKTWAQGATGPMFNLEPVEDALRNNLAANFASSLLYVKFTKNGENYTEPLFRGPRTAKWLAIPRWQGNDILLYAPADEMVFCNSLGAVFSDAQINAAVASANVRFVRFDDTTLADGNRAITYNAGLYPFVTPAFYGAPQRVNRDDSSVDFPMGNNPRWAAEQVNTWADVDTDGDGMRDSIWLPMPKDVDLSTDGLDNDLDGVPDPPRTPTPGNASVVDEEGNTLHDFEIGAFAYAVDVDSGRIVRGPDDVGASGTVARLTLPLPGMRIAIDMNNDGQLNELDRYTAGLLDKIAGEYVCVILPPQIQVPRADGTTATLTIQDTDRLDNDYDLFVNGFSAYAFLGDPNNTTRGAEAEAPDADYVNGNFQALGVGDPPKINSSVNARTKYANAVIKWPAVAPGIAFSANAPAWLTAPAALAPVVISVSGEPVCDVIGRAAIHVADETAKVNMNAVGGHVYRGDISPGKIANAGNMIGRAVNEGASTFEYETRALPEVGLKKANYFWGMLTGAGFMRDAPAGTLWDFSTLPVENQTLADAIPHAPLQPFAYDISLPGYGRVDDNINALLLAFNGRADAGTFLPDQGLWIPFLSPLTQRVYRDGLTVSDARQNLVNDERHAPGATLAPHAEVAAARVRRPADDYLNRLGMMEGIDEPGELRSAAPLRNLLAETDSLANNTNGVSGDNNNDGIANEIGEAGDRLLGNHYELQKSANQAGSRNFAAADWPDLKNFVTANSDARNVNYVETAQGLRAVNKIDPNLAPPAQLAAAMITKGDIRPATDYPWKGDGNYKISLPSLLTLPKEPGYEEDIVKKLYFAEGLRQADTTVEGWIFAEGPVVPRGGTDLAMPRFEADAELQAMQVAVNVADSRDADPARSLLVMDKRVNAGYQTWLEQWFTERGLPTLPSTPFPQPEPLNAREKIDEKDLFPVGDFQEYLINALGGKNADKRVVAVDAWWQYLTQSAGVREDRPISYAVAGADAIRISEMMVRPVRRIEAEADTSGTTQNLNPTPKAGMPVFDLAMTLPLGAGNSAWKMRSPYDTAPAGGGAAATDPYILGDETAWVYDSAVNPGWTQAGDGTPLNVNTDIVEFRIKATDGMPPGRYYLTVNVVDPTTGQMTVTDVDQLEYSVKYFNSDTATYGAPNGTISDDVAFIENLVTNTATETAQKARLRADYFEAFWQSVDQPEFIANSARRDAGSAAPEGWVFAPGRPLDQDLFPDAADYADLQGSNSGMVFADLFDVPRDTTAPQPYPPLGPPYPADAPFRWSQAYFRDSVQLVDTATSLVGADQPASGVATLTVNVPPGNPAVSQYDTVCIAFRLKPLSQNLDPNTGLPRKLAVNFLDFSQQPDHEYVELQNTTDKMIDLEGWTLEIGIPDPVGMNDSDPVERDPFKSRWGVPVGTVIAPKGYLLLGFDKFDGFQGSPADLINANGMGLAAGTADRDNPANVLTAGQYVTEPPIAATTTTAPALYNVLADATGSVFRRNASAAAAGVVDTDWADLVDNDGDGVSSAPFVYGTGSGGAVLPAVMRTPNLLDRDTDGVAAEVRYHGNDDGVVPPYARIVQLTAKELWWDKPYRLDTAPVDTIDSLARVAEVVLRGGFLPDYPEHDGYDNDGDGGYAYTATALDGTLSVAYTRGTLDKDMVDNNLDGSVDECGRELAGVFDANPFLSEGVDEGSIAPYYFQQDGYRPRTLGYGSFEEGSLPLWMTVTVASYNEWATALKQGLVGNTQASNFWSTYLPSQGFPCNPAAFSENGFPMALTTAVNPVVFPENPANPQAPRFSPEWQAFCERRWNPGDNVIVTLYVGPSSDRRVADRATYRELDVTNRAVDDIAPSLYSVDGYRNFDYDNTTGATTWAGASTDAVANVVCLDRNRPQYWLPNQMGLDFYRSLERKHPLYAGDKFGTANRWEATDGSYDDWADSVGPLVAAENRSQPYNPFQPGTTSRTVNPLSLLDDAHTRRLFGHAVPGSPLRMNATQRIWDNPPDLVALLVEDGDLTDPEDLTTGTPTLLSLDGGRRRQFVESDSVGIQLGALTQTFDSRAYTLRRAEVRNRPFNSVADLMKVALPGFRLELGPNNYRFQTNGYTTDYAERTVNAAVNTRWLPYLANPLANNPPIVWRQDLSLARTLVANAANRDQATADQQSGNGFAALGELSEIGPVTLTVGQATFRPILADPTLAASQADAAAMLHWNLFQSGGKLQVKAPHAWTPVMLLAGYPTDTPPWSTLPRWGVAYPPPLPIGVPAADKITLSWPAPAAWPRWYTWPVSGQQGPFDSSYRSADAPYLVQTEFLRDPERFSQVFGLLSKGDVDFRWPKQRLTPAAAVNPAGPPLQSVEYPRAVMYVSQHNSAYDDHRAEGVFSWDAADGLENGTYVAYVATFIPGMGDSLLRADNAAVALAEGNAPSAVPQYEEPLMPWTTDTPPVRDPIAQKLCDLDPSRPHAAGEDRFDPVLAMDFITDPTIADRLAPEPSAAYAPSPNANRTVPAMPHPRNWYPDKMDTGQRIVTATQYRPDGDGMVLYTGNGQTAWRAKLVRVTDRFLALRVRNLGGANQVACITAVVLAPARHVAGKININTAENGRVIEGESASAANYTFGVFNTLLGLPGVIDALSAMRESTGKDTYTPAGARVMADSNIGWPGYSVATSTIDDPLAARWPSPVDFANQVMPPSGPRTGTGDTAATVLGPVNTSGDWKGNFDGVAAMNLSAMIMAGRTERYDGRYYRDLGELTAFAASGGKLAERNVNFAPLSNENRPDWRFDEISTRFGRMANLITTRSDVFEILVMVQSGATSDVDGDNRVNYRNGDEFTVTAESQGRVIYERRAKADRSDDAVN